MTPDLEQALAAEKARVADLERHRDMLKHLLDEANDQHFDATMRAEAAESSVASLTRLVGDMREALELYADRDGYRDGDGNIPDPDPGAAAREILHRIRALPLPALSTTGEPVGADGWRSMDSAPKDGTQVLVFCPSYYQGRGGVSWAVFVHNDWMDSRAFKTEPTRAGGVALDAERGPVLTVRPTRSPTAIEQRGER